MSDTKKQTKKVNSFSSFLRKLEKQALHQGKWTKKKKSGNHRYWKQKQERLGYP